MGGYQGKQLTLTAPTNVTSCRVWILPLGATHTVFGESFVVFGFGADSEQMLQDVVSTEQLLSSHTLEGERETYLHRIAFQMLSDAALDPVASREFILDMAESYWSGAQRRVSA